MQGGVVVDLGDLTIVPIDDHRMNIKIYPLLC